MYQQLFSRITLISRMPIGSCAGSYEVTQFDELPNLYFDDMGETRMYYKEWKAVICHNLNEITLTSGAILHGIQEMAEGVENLQLKGVDTSRDLADLAGRYYSRFFLH